MLLNRDIPTEMLGSSGSCSIRDSTSLVKEDQSTPFWPHLTFLGVTDWYLILWLMRILVDQLEPQRDKSGFLSFSVIRLVRVAEPSFKTYRSLLMIQSVILSHQASGGLEFCLLFGV